MFKRPHLTIVFLLHVIGIIVLAALDSRQIGEQLADALGLGMNSELSKLGTQLLGREFSDWNLVADIPNFLMASLIMSLLGVLAVWFAFGCNTAWQRWLLVVAGALWTVFTFLLIPAVMFGDAFTIEDWLVGSLLYTGQFVGICGIVYWFRWTTYRADATPTGIGDRFSLGQTLGLVTCLAIGLAMKGVDGTIAQCVLFSLLTGISACLVAWSWQPRKLYRMAATAAVACALGILPLVALGNDVGREGTAWLFFSLATGVSMLGSFALLGSDGRKEIGLA